MPALEFLYWQDYFRNRPWTYVILERNFARLTAFVFNSSLRAKQRISVDELIPHYLKERPIVYVYKSRAQQREEFHSFKMRLKALKEQRNRKPI